MHRLCRQTQGDARSERAWLWSRFSVLVMLLLLWTRALTLVSAAPKENRGLPAGVLCWMLLAGADVSTCGLACSRC